jgi:hypothetical protein
MKQPKYLDVAFEEICREMTETFIRKHKDYGKGNILSIKELGIAFRISEKVERLKHLLMCKSKSKNETVDDSWIDIGVYAVIALLYKKGWFRSLEMSKKNK